MLSITCHKKIKKQRNLSTYSSFQKTYRCIDQIAVNHSITWRLMQLAAKILLHFEVSLCSCHISTCVEKFNLKSFV